MRGDCIETEARTAEMVKLTENAYRDTNIAFANELSLICDHVDINVWEVIELANRHPRVNILKPGPGVGGHCIAVDPWFIVDAAPHEAQLIRTAREVNDGKADYVLASIERADAKAIRTATSPASASTFKANVDDLRESPALEIAERLAEDARQAHLGRRAVRRRAAGRRCYRAGARKIDLDQALEGVPAFWSCWSITSRSARCRRSAATARSSTTRAVSGARKGFSAHGIGDNKAV